MHEEEKLKIKNSSILLSITFALFAVLVLLSVLPRSLHNKHLSKTISLAIEQIETENNEIGRYELGKRENLFSTLSYSTYVFELKDNYGLMKSENNEKNYAILTRVVGMNGAVPVIFIGNSSQLDFFVIAGTKVQPTNFVLYGLSPSILKYHSENLQNALKKGDKKKDARKK